MVGLVIHYFLMFGFGPLTGIVIIFAILIQRLFFLCVCSHYCSYDAILVILSCLDHHVSFILPYSFDYSAHCCGSGIRSSIVPVPHSCGFCDLCLGFVCLNIGCNFVNNGSLIIVSWIDMFASVIGVFIFLFHIIQCTICPVVAVFACFICPVIGFCMRIIFSGVFVVIVHS